MEDAILKSKKKEVARAKVWGGVDGGKDERQLRTERSNRVPSAPTRRKRE